MLWINMVKKWHNAPLMCTEREFELKLINFGGGTLSFE